MIETIETLRSDKAEMLAALKLAEATLLKISATKEEMIFKIDAISTLGKVIAKVGYKP